MTDFRFPSAGVDARFPSPNVDRRFALPDIDRYFPKDWPTAQEDGRFERGFAVDVLGPVSMFDLLDTTSLYQDSVGATPVTAHGDPIGLMLDKSQMGGKTAAQFIADQPELVTNGNFSDGLTGWSDHSNAGGITSVVDGALHVQYDTDIARIRQNDIFEEGNWYILTFDCSGATCSLYQGGSISIGTCSLGKNIFIFKAEEFAGELSIRNFASGTTAIIDNISIKEVPGQHLTQATASQRPLYQVDGTILTDGVDDRLEGAISGFTDECTIAIDFVYQGGTGSFDWPISLNNGTTSEEFGAFIRSDRADISFKITGGGSDYTRSVDVGTVNVGDRFTFVASLQANSVVIDVYKDSAFVRTIMGASTVGVPTITQLQLATAANAKKVGGNFGRLAIFNTALAETERALVAQWMFEPKTIEQIMAPQPELWNEDLVTINGDSEILGSGRYRIYSSGGAFSNVQIDERDDARIVDGDLYLGIFTVESYVNGAVKFLDQGTPRTTTGTYSEIVECVDGKLEFKRSAATDAIINNVSVKKLPPLT
jgi:hypothetical protein